MPAPAPAVPQVPAGWAPSPADMTTWVTTPFTFLAGPAAFRGELHGSQPLSGWTLAALDTITEDPYGGWSATTTASQAAHSWLCPPGCSGWYEITVTGLCTNPGAGALIGAAVWLNGAIYQQLAMEPADVGNTVGASGAMMVPLQGGYDYVQPYIYSSASTSTPAVFGRYPTMEIAWMSN